jgi:hypothetical protein
MWGLSIFCGTGILPVQMTGWKPVTESEDRLEAGPTACFSHTL